MQNGLMFEMRLAEELRHLGCAVTTCESWDDMQKTDFLISRIGGRRLHTPVAVQVTRQINNLIKVSRYLRWVDSGACASVRPLYVEFSETIPAAVAAQAVHGTLAEMAAHRAPTRDFVQGMSMTCHSAYVPFSVREHGRRLLAESEASLRSAARMPGRLVGRRSGAFMVKATDDVVRLAYYSDIIDLALYGRMRTALRGNPRRCPRSREMNMDVTFIPDLAPMQTHRCHYVVAAPPQEPTLPRID